MVSIRVENFILNQFVPRFFAVTLLCAFGSSTQAAEGDIFRCEGETGIPTYQNVGGKNCKKVDIAPLSAIPAPKQPAGAAKVSTSAKSPSPADFPKVDLSAQQTRDSDRKRIIEDELKKEESKLAELKKDFNGGEPERRGDERNAEKYQTRIQKMREDIARSESSVGSLKRELSLIRG